MPSLPPARYSAQPRDPATAPAAWRARLAALAAGAHDAIHLERVWRNAQAPLAHHPEADALVVQAACYLHDLVNLPKNHPERAQASTRAARLARVEPARLLAFRDEFAAEWPGADA